MKLFSLWVGPGEQYEITKKSGEKRIKKRPYKDLLRLEKSPFNIVGKLVSPT